MEGEWTVSSSPHVRPRRSQSRLTSTWAAWATGAGRRSIHSFGALPFWASLCSRHWGQSPCPHGIEILETVETQDKPPNK